jgi:hypothetical protein
VGLVEEDDEREQPQHEQPDEIERARAPRLRR